MDTQQDRGDQDRGEQDRGEQERRDRDRRDQGRNIVLIGMPGAGKSTAGVVLAKRLGLEFQDCDLVIQRETGKRLSEIIDESGLEGFLATEDRIIASLEVSHHVIATGGSAVYGAAAMTHLRDIGVVVYLQLPFESIRQRVGDLTDRGVAMREGQTLLDLYRERVPLYEQYAHLVIDCETLQLREVVATIDAELVAAGWIGGAHPRHGEHRDDPNRTGPN